jgi:hypothetical protein
VLLEAAQALVLVLLDWILSLRRRHLQLLLGRHRQLWNVLLPILLLLVQQKQGVLQQQVLLLCYLRLLLPTVFPHSLVV